MKSSILPSATNIAGTFLYLAEEGPRGEGKSVNCRYRYFKGHIGTDCLERVLVAFGSHLSNPLERNCVALNRTTHESRSGLVA